jgi:hypothetical protein
LYDEEFKFESLKGKVLTSIDPTEGDEVIIFKTKDETFRMFHSSECCESVNVEEIVGDLNDLLNSEILLAEEVSSCEPDSLIKSQRELEKLRVKDSKTEYYSEPESETWTFYKLSTIKGSVTIRWYGTSNGYYSERVSFYKINK